MKPMIVLGFGRSGTTWLADVISKLVGGLVLFEPLHPSVTDRSKKMSYRRVLTDDDSTWLASYIRSVLSKRHKRLWLMRNHVPVAIDKIDQNFYHYLWRECSIAGFKDIRLNFTIPWLAKHDFGTLLFVVRDPRAVVASILSRPNFWEFGWPGTYDLIIGNMLSELALTAHPAMKYAELARSAEQDFERITILWALTHAIALEDCAQYDIPVVRYEELYAQPFHTVRKIMQDCDLAPKPIHPSYIFSPSLTTRRTFHGIYSIDKKVKRNDFSFFWDQILNPQQCSVIEKIVCDFGLEDQLTTSSDCSSAWQPAPRMEIEKAPQDAVPHLRHG